MTDFIFSRTIQAETDTLQNWIDSPSVNKWIYIDNWSEYYAAVSNAPGYFLYSVYCDNRLTAHIAAELVDSSVHISLIVDPERQRKGFGQAVLSAMIKHSEILFGKIDSIVAVIYPGNEKSINCFAKCGFIQKGCESEGGIVFEFTIT